MLWILGPECLAGFIQTPSCLDQKALVEAVSKKLQLAIEKGLIPQHNGLVAKDDEAPE